MNRETYTHHVQELALMLVQTDIDSIRRKDILRTGLRVYQDGKIGVAGAIGPSLPGSAADPEQLTRKAIAALDLNIPYPYELASDRVETVEPEQDLPQDQAFVEEMEQMLAELRTAQPGFSFSNKIALTTDDVRLANDRGLDLHYRGTSVELSLWIKDKKSSNIIDAGVGYQGWRYERTEFLRLCNLLCDTYQRKVDLEEGTYPVFFAADDYVYRSLLLRSLHGLLYGTGGSLFSGKIGQKLFDDCFTVYQTRNWHDDAIGPFFDMEGTVTEGYRFDLIQDGVLLAPMTDKKYAARFGLPLTGSAGGAYDSVPSLSIGTTRIASTGQTIRELVGDRKGILVMIASGGDFTPDGGFGTPAQLAYLMEGDRLVGRLPEISVSSHLYNMFGRDFIGVSTDSLTTLAQFNLIAMNMQVSKL